MDFVFNVRRFSSILVDLGAVHFRLNRLQLDFTYRSPESQFVIPRSEGAIFFLTEIKKEKISTG